MRERDVLRAGIGITLFISNEYKNDIIKIIKSLENSRVLIDGISETIKHESKKDVEFPNMLLGTLGASMLRNELTGKGGMRAGDKIF